MQIRGSDPKFLYYFNIFFKKTFVVSKILFTFAPEKPTYVKVGAICTASLERTFSKRYCLYYQISQVHNHTLNPLKIRHLFLSKWN